MAENNKPLILIVDDTVINLDILTQMLENDYDIVAVNNGQEALEVLEEEAVDLVLLDIMMPEMDGYQILAEIKKNPELTSLPVIFMTALDDKESKSRAFEGGAADYITKPFEMREILDKIGTRLP